MIITRTPFRISFFGGGTDYPAWYKQNGGKVLATTIDKYCYISVRDLPPFFEYKHRIVYSRIESVKEIDEIVHPAVKGILNYYDCTQGLEIHHDGDLPARSGLGSSSSFTVGLLHALDEVRKSEGQIKTLPKHLRSAVLKKGDSSNLTQNQQNAIGELLDQGLDTATAWRIKERLRWIRLANTPRAAKWRITRFINYARTLIGDNSILEPVTKSLNTLERHTDRVIRRWTSNYTNARLEGLNSLFQAARARARGYRNSQTFITMIYMIASPVGSMLKST